MTRGGNNYWYVDDPILMEVFKKRDQEAISEQFCKRCRKNQPIELIPLGPYIALCKTCSNEWWDSYEEEKKRIQDQEE